MNIRAGIHAEEGEAQPEPAEDFDQAWRRQGRQPRVGNRLRQPQENIFAEPRCDLLVEEPPQAAVLRIDAPQQLALVETQRQPVISLRSEEHTSELQSR